MNFQISALDRARFEHLFSQDNDALADLCVQRRVADENPGFPCRISLQDATVGESVLLLNFEHQSARSPFRASHAIFVRENAVTAKPDVSEVPRSLRCRLLSMRAFDDAGMICDADLVEGHNIESLIERMFRNRDVRYLHVHNARLGCYLAQVNRLS